MAQAVAAGELSLSQAQQAVQDVSPESLPEWVQDAWRYLGDLHKTPGSDQAFIYAFLELGTAASLRAQLAYPYLNFAMNLGHFVCAQLDDPVRGVQLMEQGFQQLPALSLSPAEMIETILAVADAYFTHHRRLGSEYLEVGTEAYRTCLRIAGQADVPGALLARAHHGVALSIMNGALPPDREQRAKVIAEAIAGYTAALECIDAAEDAPLYGLILHNLGNAYRLLASLEGLSCLDQAAQCLAAAQQVRRTTGEPGRLRLTSSILADVEDQLGHPMRAVAALEGALETLDPIREWQEYAELSLRLAAICARASYLSTVTEQRLTSLARACYTVAIDATAPDRGGDTWAGATAGLANMLYRDGKVEEALALDEKVLTQLDRSAYADRCARVATDYVQMLASWMSSPAGSGPARATDACRAKLEDALGIVRASSLRPFAKLVAEVHVARADHRMTTDAAQEQALRQHVAALTAECLAESGRDIPMRCSEQIEDMLRDMLEETGQGDALRSLVERRLAREPSFLGLGPSLVDYYDFCERQAPYWNLAVGNYLRSGDTCSAWRQADLARGRVLDLLAGASQAREASGAISGEDVPAHVRGNHAALVAEWKETMRQGDAESDFRRDALAPWLRDSFIDAARWRGFWAIARPTEAQADRFDDLVFSDVPTALVEFWCTGEQARAFLKLPGEPEPRVLQFPDMGLARQTAWLNQWISSYSAFERQGQSAIPAWSRTLDRLSLELGEAIWAPMHDALDTTNIQRVIIIPDLWLDALPLTAIALDRKPGREFFAQRYQVGYCPSLRMLARSMQRPESMASRAVFLGNPQAVCPTRECTDRCSLSLPSADAELASLRENWPEVESLMGTDVTVARFREIISRVRPGLLHVCAHGLTRFDDPLASGFLCAMDDPAKDDPLVVYLNHELVVTWGTNACGEVLTLDALLRCADLRQCRLTVLNVCEMGLGWIGSPRETPSIANGFLAAGVPTVIAPLWPIAAPAARLLTSRFYAELRHDRHQKLRALTYAQRWLSNLSRGEAEKLVPREQIDAGVLVSGEDRPFSHPFFWAPFRLLGCPI